MDIETTAARMSRFLPGDQIEGETGPFQHNQY
jgi:hypothetical protein